MDILSLTGIPSPTVFIEDRESLEETPVGSGPYVIDEYSPEIEASFVRNPDYWNPGAYPYDTVTLKPFADSVAALNALKSGQIDATSLETASAIEAKASGFRINEGTGRFATLQIRDYKGIVQPALGDKRVRQAMNLAFDREAILENINLGLGSVSSQPFTEGQYEWVPDGDARYAYDPERARELLAEAGYPDGFTITIPTSPASGMSAYEPIIQQSLADIGITVEFETHVDDWYAASIAPEATVSLFFSYFVVSSRFLIEDPLGGQTQFFPTPESEMIELWNEFKDSDPNNPDEESRAAASELGELILDNAYYVPIAKPAIVWASTQAVTVDVGTTVARPLLKYLRPAG
jgi:peptide/nickel transport system substrate-binding protein